jgi:hypothetical protein
VVISLAALLRGRLSAGHRTMLSAWHSCGDRLHRKSHLGLRREPTARRLVHIPADVDWSWEMALVAALAYWAIHASVDWLWQMAAVAIPALLILAAGLAGADAGGSTAGHDVIEERGGSAGRKAKTATTLFRVSLLSVSLVTIVMSGMPYLAGESTRNQPLPLQAPIPPELRHAPRPLICCSPPAQTLSSHRRASTRAQPRSQPSRTNLIEQERLSTPSASASPASRRRSEKNQSPGLCIITPGSRY